MNTITCCECGVAFGVPERWYEERRRDHAWFHCPNGHQQHFTAESDLEKLRRERDRLAQRIAEKDDDLAAARRRAEHTEASLRTTKGHITRIKNRVGHGVCPCCTRSFSNLQRHMATEHPRFINEGHVA